MAKKNRLDVSIGYRIQESGEKPKLASSKKKLHTRKNENASKGQFDKVKTDKDIPT